VIGMLEVARYLLRRVQIRDDGVVDVALAWS